MRKSSKQAEQDKSKLQRVKDLPWALLLQMGLVLGKRWRSLSAKERRELKKLVGKLHPKRTARDLVLLTRARRRRKRR